MSVYIDNVEGRNSDLRQLADGVWTLDWEKDGQTYFYDILVVAEGRELRFERKRFPSDFVGSWQAGYLERQLTGVDGLIVEYDPLNPDIPSQRRGESDESWEARLASWAEWKTKAWMHLAPISAAMWVIFTDGPIATMSVMRAIERNPQLHVRTNLMRVPKLSPRQRLLASLRGVNPARPLDDGRTLGEAAEQLIDWPALVRTLKLDEWTWKGNGRRVLAGPGSLRLRLSLEKGEEKEGGSEDKDPPTESPQRGDEV